MLTVGGIIEFLQRFDPATPAEEALKALREQEQEQETPATDPHLAQAAQRRAEHAQRWAAAMRRPLPEPEAPGDQVAAGVRSGTVPAP